MVRLNSQAVLETSSKGDLMSLGKSQMRNEKKNIL